MSFGVNLVPLGELGEIASGSTPNTFIKEYWDGDIPWITPADLTEHTGIYFKGSLRKITKAGYNSCSTKLLPKGTILYSSRAPIGHCAVTTFPLCTNQGFKSIVPNVKLDSVYGFFALKFFTPQLVAQGRGATFSEINKEIMENFRIPLPPLTEQRCIATLLDKADRLRRQCRYALELSNTYLQSVFLEMFGDPVTNPKGWEIEHLGNILSIPPHIGTIVPAKEGGEQLCVRVGEVGEWHINLNQCKYASLSGHELKRCLLLPGDIVLARAIGSESHLGKLSTMGSSSIPVVFDSHLMRLRPDNSRLLTPFLVSWLKTDGGRARFMRQARRTAVQFNINTEQISSIEITVPPLPLQHKFAQIVQRFERFRAQQLEALRQADHLFQTLLHQAFQGEFELRSAAVDMLPMAEGADDVGEVAVYQLPLLVE